MMPYGRTEMSPKEIEDLDEVILKDFARCAYNLLENAYYISIWLKGSYFQIADLNQEYKNHLAGVLEQRLRTRPVVHLIDDFEGRLKEVENQLSDLNGIKAASRLAPYPDNHLPKEKTFLYKVDARESTIKVGDTEVPDQKLEPAFSPEDYSEDESDTLDYVRASFKADTGDELSKSDALTLLDLMRGDYPESDEWYIRARALEMLLKNRPRRTE